MVMKTKMISLTLALAILVCSTSGCGASDSASSQTQTPGIAQIRSICELATLECYYHNVAKSVKFKEEGITHLGEKDRTFWIEYTGTVKLGIDMSQVSMDITDHNVTITIPEAEVLEVSVDDKSYNENSYIMSQDGWNSNKITAEDTTEAVKVAKEKMKQTAMENSSLLLSAQERAKKLIENYLLRLGDSVGVEYNINWKYIDSDSDTE